MRLLLRTNDVVLISYVSHLLDEAGINFEVFDSYISAVEGSIGAFPRRIMVAEDEFEAARRVLGNATITIPD
jgi:hypothetical protein